MKVSQQKLLKTIHLMAAGTWLACVFVLMTLSLIATRFTKGDEIITFNYIYYVVDMFVLTPSAIMTFITGLIYSLFTPWGFFKHRWLVFKWIVTVGIILVGTFYLGPLVEKLLALAENNREAVLLDPSYTKGGKIGLWAAYINSTLLILAVTVSVYKPSFFKKKKIHK